MNFIATTYIDQSQAAKFEEFKANFESEITATINHDRYDQMLEHVISWALEQPSGGIHDELVKNVTITNDHWGESIFEVRKTSNGNVAIQGFIHSNADDLDEVFYAVAYSGTRHRFQMDIKWMAYDIPKTFTDENDWEIYETEGDGDMLPWESELDFIVRIADEFRASQDAGNPNEVLYAKISRRARVAYDAMIQVDGRSSQTHAGIIAQWDRLQNENERLQPIINQIRRLNEHVRLNVV